MGKTTGFLEYPRVTAGYRPVTARVKDYDEISLPPDPEELHRQSARCMDCGVPFCHAAFVVEGGSIGCPLANLIPEINDLVYRGKVEEAYWRLAKTHPFPEFTGRVCPALCEGSCTLGEHEPAVAIKDIERHVADTVLQGGLSPRVPKQRLGRRVAVVGSGPAGLAAADMLNQLGNLVTVFEKDDRPGGLLMYGIPNMKLDKAIVLNRVHLLEQEGITFRLGTEIGADYPVLRLMQEFDAIVLCAGAGEERKLEAPGAKLAGVATAMQYLTASTRQLLAGEKPNGDDLDAKGKNVVVVGGGDTGTDCVATAIRQGAASVAQLEILPMPPASRAENNPWPLWPRIHRTDYGQQEAQGLFGKDPREYTTTVKELVDDGAGRVQAVTTVKVEWQKAPDGRMAPVEVPGTEETRPADLVLTAMGFTGPKAALPTQLGLALDGRGNVQTGEGYHSSLARVFAAGDMRRGPSLVVWAIDEGRKAALQCHEYLNKR